MSTIILALIASLTITAPAATTLLAGLHGAPAAIQHQHNPDQPAAGCAHCKDGGCAKHADGASCCKDGTCEGCCSAKADGAEKTMSCGDCCKGAKDGAKDGKGCCGDSCKMGKDKAPKQASAARHCPMMGR